MSIDTQKEGIEEGEGETKLCKSRPVPQKENRKRGPSVSLHKNIIVIEILRI